MTLPANVLSRIPTTSSSRPSRIAVAVALLVGFAGALAFTNVARAQNNEIARADRQFMTRAAEANHTEINASRIALEKATLPAVKEYANMMITDHTKASDELRALATAKGVKLPDDPAAMQKAKIAVLGKLNGNNFDKQYANIVGVNSHEATIKLFRNASANAKDADVKAFATKMLPSLEHHLQMARAMKSQVDAAGDTRGRNSGGMTGTNTGTMPAAGANANTGGGTNANAPGSGNTNAMAGSTATGTGGTKGTGGSAQDGANTSARHAQAAKGQQHHASSAPAASSTGAMTSTTTTATKTK